MRMLLGDDGTGGTLQLLTTESRPVVDWASGRLVQAIDAHWPGVAAADVSDLADALVRLAISHVAVPRDKPARTAASITRLLGPSIEGMLAAAGER